MMHRIFNVCLIVLALPLALSMNAIAQTAEPQSEEIELVKYPINIYGILGCGKNAEWDFSKFELGNQKFIQTVSIVRDSVPMIMTSEHGVLSRFQRVPEGILEKSYESSMMKMTYERSPMQLVLPMTYGNRMRGLYSAIGTYCDKVKMRVFGNYETRVFGTGTIITPEGDTLRNATCVECHKLEWVIYYPLYADLKSWSFTQDSILNNSLYDNKRKYNMVDRWFWFVKGLPYPIVTFSIVHTPLSGGGRICQGYYYPPQEQPASATMLAEVLPGESFHDTPFSKLSHDIGFNYKFTTNAATHKAVVNYTCKSACDVVVLLCNSSGIVYHKEERHGDTSGEIYLDYGALKKGQYIVYIKCGMETEIEKFNNN